MRGFMAGPKRFRFSCPLTANQPAHLILIASHKRVNIGQASPVTNKVNRCGNGTIYLTEFNFRFGIGE